MAKKVTGSVKLQIEAGNAKPGPPVGPALAQQGLSKQLGQFCSSFNEESLKHYDQGKVLPVVVTIYSDSSFTFEIKSPPATEMLKEIAGVAKGSSEPNVQKIGTVTKDQLEEIAKVKWPDLSANDMDSAIKIIAGSAKSMGLRVEGLDDG